MWWHFLGRPYVPAAIAGTLIVSTVAAVIVVHRLQRLTAQMVEENVSSLRAAEEMELAIRDIRSRLYQFALSGDSDYLQDLPGLDTRFGEWFQVARASATTPKEQSILDAVSVKYAEYQRGFLSLAEIPERDQASADAQRLGDTCSRDLLPLCHSYLDINERTIEVTAETHHGLSGRLQSVLIVAGLVIPLAGVFLGYVVSRSVSMELEESRERLRRSEQLAAVGRLAAGMAHELRNPLTSILMMVQTSSENDPADLSLIEDEVRRMELTIQSCLDFARPRQLQRTLTDLREVVNYVVRVLQARLRRQHIVMDLHVDASPLWTQIDPYQIQQVLLNLLMNAMDSVGVGGRIGVVATAADSWVTLAVWDEGAGIPRELLPRIFDPFVTGKESGTGLGLSICKQIVDSHGGIIVACNRPQLGAEFQIQLPRHGGPSDAATPGDRRRTEHSALLSTSLSR